MPEEAELATIEIAQVAFPGWRPRAGPATEGGGMAGEVAFAAESRDP